MKMKRGLSAYLYLAYLLCLFKGLKAGKSTVVLVKQLDGHFMVNRRFSRAITDATADMPPSMRFKILIDEGDREVELTLTKTTLQYPPIYEMLDGKMKEVTSDITTPFAFYEDEENRAGIVVTCGDKGNACSLSGSFTLDGTHHGLYPIPESDGLHKLNEIDPLPSGKISTDYLVIPGEEDQDDNEDKDEKENSTQSVVQDYMIIPKNESSSRSKRSTPAPAGMYKITVVAIVDGNALSMSNGAEIDQKIYSVMAMHSLTLEGASTSSLKEFSTYVKNAGIDEHNHYAAFTADGSSSGTVGIAWLGSGCSTDRYYRTSVNEITAGDQTNVLVAEIVAHEMGHSLGMYHDFEGVQTNRKYSNAGELCTGIGGVMDYTLNPDKWSPCSNEDFRTYYDLVISQATTFCLNPVEAMTTTTTKAPKRPSSCINRRYCEDNKDNCCNQTKKGKWKRKYPCCK